MLKGEPAIFSGLLIKTRWRTGKNIKKYTQLSKVFAGFQRCKQPNSYSVSKKILIYVVLK